MHSLLLQLPLEVLLEIIKLLYEDYCNVEPVRYGTITAVWLFTEH